MRYSLRKLRGQQIMLSIKVGASRGPSEERTMKFVARMISTVAAAFLLVPALYAGDTPEAGPTAKKGETVNSRVALRTLAKAKPASATAAPLPATAMPQRAAGAGSGSARQSTGDGTITPKAELFLGYSFIRATPRSTGNRIAWLHGGDANIA